MTDLATVLSDKEPIPSWTTYATNIKSAANAKLWDQSTGLFTDNTTTTFNPQDGNVFAIISGVADNGTRAATVAANLRARWTPYGPPAPEAGPTISPFITSFELQAHVRVGAAQRSIDLMKSMYYGFMMDNPDMTNSTFIEGYCTNGSLIYPAYKNNPRISHAHGWSTGPTTALSTLIAGIQFVGAAGKTWLFSPAVGDLAQVAAGFTSPLGMFEASYEVVGDGFLYEFSAPKGTSGNVSVAKPAGCKKAGVAVLSQYGSGRKGGRKVMTKKVPVGTEIVGFEGLEGGDSVLFFTC